jgi:uncharacterized protein (TIGR00297 family)
MPYIIGSLLAVTLFTVTYFGKHLTVGGAALAAFIVGLFSFFSLWGVLIFLLSVYAILMVVDKATSRFRKLISDGINEKSGARTAIQILANGFAALISITLYLVTDSGLFLIIYAVGIGEVFTDSISSDIGVLSKSEPRDICSWNKIPSGISGGVSLLGIGACFVASAVLGIISFLCIGTSFFETVMIAVFSFLGSIIDSVLGSRLQTKYQCEICNAHTEKKVHCGISTKSIGGVKYISNCSVNFISNFITCGLCLILMLIIGAY